MAKGWTDKRPMSPHMSVWKWHPTMLSSILHRASGVVLYMGLLKICLVLAFLASGSAGYEKMSGLMFSPIGVFAFFAFSGILIFHLLNGIRHLVWDAGKGFDPKLANVLSLLIILAAAIIAAIMTYILVGSFA